MEMPIPRRPFERRTFELTPASADSSYPPTPAEEHHPELLNDNRRSDLSPQKTRSILNLTSSTLFGIYSGTSESGGQEGSTPWGTGAQTPSKRRSIDGNLPEEPQITWSDARNKPQNAGRAKSRRTGFRGYVVPLALQTVLLFAFGAGFGAIVTHLHQTQQITPVPVPGTEKITGYYHFSWGLFGILVGNGLPLVDKWLSEEILESEHKPSGHKRTVSSSSDDDRETLGPMWYSAVRSVGAFVGIAFAVETALVIDFAVVIDFSTG
ncbi:uncharacterized protein AB675_551 [Cyphellophora attinorum]|uniref:Uncharacterized protein n=1 Tax=Cyphellophora attinorum TaxID=1664694 RepID=A0A0N1P4K9_9EURO|nr:uncharacterized protein AB675_551 [Phialophora attinorum]KPI45940.1 hypothetical protein AB675_551 [Phialophora attinorum]